MMFLAAIILFALSTVGLFVLEFKKMGWASRSLLLVQIVAIYLNVYALLGISF
jgi:hypothetical protein